MKKIALFVEGESEAIFTYNAIRHLFENESIKISAIKIRIDYNWGETSVIHDYNNSSNPCISFYIFIAGGDEKVLSSIIRSQSRLIKESYAGIIGLRDMSCQEYDEKSRSKYDATLIEQMKRNINEKLKEELKKLPTQNENISIKMCFSVMELETWYLAFTEILTSAFSIKEDVLLKKTETIETIYRPKNKLEKLLHGKYEKTKFAYKFSKNITLPYINDVMKRNTVPHFNDYINTLKMFA